MALIDNNKRFFLFIIYDKKISYVIIINKLNNYV